MLLRDRSSFGCENQYLLKALRVKISFTLLYGFIRSKTRNLIVTPMFLAIDAGGTSTRAVALDVSGRSFGYGRAGSGNPTAVGISSAVSALGLAAERALAGDASVLGGPSVAVVAMAGQQTGPFVDELTVRLAGLRIGRVSLQPDLLGIFHSGTHELDGYALISGTGSVAARVRDGRLDRVVGGKGWLLGDGGSGFWIGHHIVRAVMAALDGQGPPTALTPALVAALEIEADPDSAAGRLVAMSQLVTILYGRPPVQLAELAPLAFAVHEDPVARDLLVTASAALANLVSVVRVPELAGPVIGGGSVLVHGMLAAPPELQRALELPAGQAQVIPVPDGVVGAAVLGLRELGVEVDAALFATVQAELARAAAPAGT